MVGHSVGEMHHSDEESRVRAHVAPGVLLPSRLPGLHRQAAHVRHLAGTVYRHTSLTGCSCPRAMLRILYGT